MRSPTKAILWEIIARNAIAVKLSIVALPVCVLVSLVVRFGVGGVTRLPNGDSPALLVSGCTFIALCGLLTLTTLFWCFSFTSMDERGQFGGFPVRLFTLPVRTWKAAALPVVAGVVALVATYALWCAIMFVALRPEAPVPWLTFAWQLLVIASGFVAVQMIVWLLYPFRFTRMVVIAAVAFGHFVAFIYAPATDFKERPAWWFAGGVTAFALFVRAAFAVVAWERHGSWGNVRVFAHRASKRVRGKFESRFAAQLWFEWKRKGWFGAGIIGVAMALALMVWTVPTGMLLIAAEEYTELPPLFEQSFLWLAPLVTAFISIALGIAFGKSDPWARDFAMSSFHATRPMSTADLVFAKLRTAFRTILIAWCVFLLATLFIFIAHPHVTHWLMFEFWPRFVPAHPELLKWIRNPFVLLTILGLQWHAMITGMSPVFSGNSWRVTISGVITMFTSAAAIGVIYWFSSYPEHFAACRPLLPAVIGAIAFWKIGRAVTGFLRARRQQLTPVQNMTLVLIWLGLLVGVGASAALALDAKRLPAEFVLFIAVWLMPSRELPMCVLNLAMNRHR